MTEKKSTSLWGVVRRHLPGSPLKAVASISHNLFESLNGDGVAVTLTVFNS